MLSDGPTKVDWQHYLQSILPKCYCTNEWQFQMDDKYTPDYFGTECMIKSGSETLFLTWYFVAKLLDYNII